MRAISMLHRPVELTYETPSGFLVFMSAVRAIVIYTKLQLQDF